MKKLSIITLIILLLLGFVLWRYWKKMNQEIGSYVDPTCDKPNFSNMPKLTNAVCMEVAVDQDLLLQLGDYNCEVRTLQTRINSVLAGSNYPLLVEDGRFGCNTEGGLKATRNVKSITLNNF